MSDAGAIVLTRTCAGKLWYAQKIINGLATEWSSYERQDEIKTIGQGLKEVAHEVYELEKRLREAWVSDEKFASEGKYAAPLAAELGKILAALFTPTGTRALKEPYEQVREAHQMLVDISAKFHQ